LRSPIRFAQCKRQGGKRVCTASPFFVGRCSSAELAVVCAAISDVVAQTWPKRTVRRLPRGPRAAFEPYRAVDRSWRRGGARLVVGAGHRRPSS